MIKVTGCQGFSCHGLFLSVKWLCWLTRCPNLQRFDGGTEREVGQRDGQTEEDEQEEHGGGAQSASADVYKQWQVTESRAAFLAVHIQDCAAAISVQSKFDKSKICWQPALHRRQASRFPEADAQSTVIGAGQQHNSQEIPMRNKAKWVYN